MLRQFLVTPELQQFLMGIDSRAFTNVVWDLSFAGDVPLLPSSPGAVRRSLFYSHLDTMASTPTEYDVFVENLDGSGSQQITSPR